MRPDCFDGKLPRLIIVHIMKTAGVTFRYIIENSYPKNFLLDDFDVRNIHEHIIYNIPYEYDYSGVAWRRKNFIMGHFSIHKYQCLLDDYNFKLITWLRDPVERTISHFNFLKHGGRWKKLAKYGKKSEWLGNEISEDRMDIIEFSELMSNFSSKFIKDINKFEWIGVVEYFDRCLFDFKTRYNLDISLKYESRNIHRKKKEIITDGQREKIRNHNKLDYEIYEEISSRWKK